MIARVDITPFHKQKLVALFTLSYPNTAQIATLTSQLETLSIPTTLIKKLPLYAQQNTETTTESVLSRTKNIVKGLKGIENVYTQHTPKITSIISQIQNSRLSNTNYPTVEEAVKDRVLDLIVYVVGGITFAEIREIEKINEKGGFKVTLCGDCILDGKAFVKGVLDS